MTGEGEIRDTFTITGRGIVLVIDDGWRGGIPRNGIIESDFGRAAYVGPDFVLGNKKEWAAVSVDPAVQRFFPKGEGVRFYSGE